MTLTTTVTWDELIAQYDAERAEYADARAEIDAVATEEYGEEWREQNVPQDPDLVPDDRMDLYVYQLQAAQLDNSIQSCDNRQDVLRTIREHYGAGDFEIKMLSGQETMDIETELRMFAEREGVEMDAVEAKRHGDMVDAAVVDAPDGIPSDDGDPTPSECPDPLVKSLWEVVNRFTTTGSVDFQSGGRGATAARSPTGDTSAPPTPSDAPSPTSDATDE